MQIIVLYFITFLTKVYAPNSTIIATISMKSMELKIMVSKYAKKQIILLLIEVLCTKNENLV